MSDPERQTDSQPMFSVRADCIACRSSNVEMIASGSFSSQPVHDFIANDPWGESPVPYIRDDRWEFVQCRACSQMYHRRVLSPQWQEHLFTRWMSAEAIRTFEADRGIDTPAHQFAKGCANVSHVLSIEKMTREIRGDSRLKVLDFGCGWGRFLDAANALGAEAYGVDKDADRRSGVAPSKIAIFPDLEELDPALRGTFHAITLFQVLEHLVEPRTTLETLRDWIAPGGILILETPDCTGVTNIQTSEDYRKINPLSHINGFTTESLRGIAERVGFRMVRRVEAHVTAEPRRVLKTEARRVLGRLLPATTNLYFVRRSSP